MLEFLQVSIIALPLSSTLRPCASLALSPSINDSSGTIRLHTINYTNPNMASPFDLTRLQIPLILEYHSMVCFRPTLASWILGDLCLTLMFF